MVGFSRRTAFVVIASLAAAGAGLTPGAAEPTRKQRLAALSEEDRAWLTDFVAPIILPEEDKIFLELAEAYQREAFKEDFWQRRERPNLNPPLGPGYRLRYEELRQLVDEKYDDWRHDAGRMVLRWGEPDSIFKPQCGGEEVFRDLEVWTYSIVDLGLHAERRHLFFRPALGAPRRLWIPGDREEDAFYSSACKRGRFSDLLKDCRPIPNDTCITCEGRCEVYKAYVEILKNGLMAQAKLFEQPAVPTEGLDRQKSKWATTSDPKARTLNVLGPSSGPIVTPTRTPTPEPPHKLSLQEIQERIQKLEPKYKDFLDLARPLMTDAELSQFLQMRSGEKDRFIREFWKRSS